MTVRFVSVDCVQSSITPDPAINTKEVIVSKQYNDIKSIEMTGRDHIIT